MWCVSSVITTEIILLIILLRASFVTPGARLKIEFTSTVGPDLRHNSRSDCSWSAQIPSNAVKDFKIAAQLRIAQLRGNIGHQRKHRLFNINIADLLFIQRPRDVFVTYGTETAAAISSM